MSFGLVRLILGCGLFALGSIGSAILSCWDADAVRQLCRVRLIVDAMAIFLRVV